LIMAVGMILGLAIFLKIPKHIWYSLILFVAWLPLLTQPTEQKNIPDRKIRPSSRLLNIYLISVMVFSYYVDCKSNRSQERNYVRYSQQLEEMASDGHEKLLFITAGSMLPFRVVLKPFANVAVFKQWHIIPFGWMNQSPIQIDMLKKYGIDDIFLAMLERPDFLIHMLPEEKSLFRTYYKERYGLEIVISLDRQSKNFSFYTFEKADVF